MGRASEDPGHYRRRLYRHGAFRLFWRAWAWKLHLLVRKIVSSEKFDPFITDAVTEELEKGGVNIHFNTSPKSFKRVDGGIEITYQDDTTAVFEKVL